MDTEQEGTREGFRRPQVTNLFKLYKSLRICYCPKDMKLFCLSLPLPALQPAQEKLEVQLSCEDHLEPWEREGIANHFIL